MHKRFLVICLSFFFSLAVHAEAWQSSLLLDHPLVGQVVAVESGNRLSDRDLFTALEKQVSLGSYLLIGEKHDNPDHHRLESKLLKRFAQPQVAVVFEMLDDKQSVYLPQLKPTHNLTQLKDQLKWSEKGWSWQDYGPLFQQVLQQGGELVAGNIDRQNIKKIYRGGEAALTPTSRYQSLSPVAKKHTGVLLDLVFESHCQQMPREHLKPMVTIQLAKDASMASALAGSEKGILIAGNVHARKDIGVAAHLAVLNKASVTVSLLEVQDEMLSISDYPEVNQGQADFVWFTPKVTDRDYCQDLKGKAKLKASS
jgi:uncharacterized iron-regulated protein